MQKVTQMEKKTDKGSLKSEVDKEDTVKGSDEYKNASEDAKKKYDDALQKAKDVLNNPNAKSKKKLIKLKEDLVNALKRFKRKTKCFSRFKKYK